MNSHWLKKKNRKKGKRKIQEKTPETDRQLKYKRKSRELAPEKKLNYTRELKGEYRGESMKEEQF